MTRQTAVPFLSLLETLKSGSLNATSTLFFYEENVAKRLFKKPLDRIGRIKMNESVSDVVDLIDMFLQIQKHHGKLKLCIN